MHYSTWTIIDCEWILSPNYNYTIEELQEEYGNQIIPAWSLSALLELIPSHIDKPDTFLRLRMDKDEKDFSLWYEEYSTGLCVENTDITESTPIEAVYKMVCWLKENNMI